MIENKLKYLNYIPNSVEYLYCTDNHILENIITYNLKNLIEININDTAIKKINFKNLEKIKNLELISIKTLSEINDNSLPPNINKLEIIDTTIKKINLNNLQYLEEIIIEDSIISEINISKLTCLKKLIYIYCGLTSADNFPINLKYLDISHNEISNFNYLPSVEYLDISYNKNVENIDNIPQSVKTLKCENNPKIKELNILHKGLKEIYITGTNITSMVNFPQGIQKISYKYNKDIEKIINKDSNKYPYLQDLLYNLIKKENEIISLNNFPPFITHLNVGNNLNISSFNNSLNNLPKTFYKLEI